MVNLFGRVRDRVLGGGLHPNKNAPIRSHETEDDLQARTQEKASHNITTFIPTLHNEMTGKESNDYGCLHYHIREGEFSLIY